MSKHFDCISIGSATVDVIIKSKEFKVVENKNFETGLAICEMYGSKTDIDDFYVGSGGGSTNSSCSLANLGLKTSCVSIIGNDIFSEYIYDDLLNFKVDTENLIVRKGEKSAFSTILTAPDGGRTVLVYRGPCSNISKKDIEDKEFNTEWIYLTNLGSDHKNAIEVIEFLKNKDLKIFWNPGLSEVENIDTNKLKLVDILNLNLEEAGKLCEIKMNKPKEILKFLVKNIPAKQKLITMGKKGAIHIKGSEVTHISSIKVEVENTVGAGDAFGSGFLYGQIKGFNTEKSLEYAIKNSVSVIQKTGSKEGFLSNLEDLPKPKVKKL